MSVGLAQGTVRLAHYDRAWPRRFAAEKRRLARHLPARGTRIEHIGSTAVPGLDAKPIIDIAVRIPSLARLDRWREALERAGYVYKGEYGLPGRHFFTHGNAAAVSRHLHVVERGSDHWRGWLLFRDYLRSHPETVADYNRFKRELARKYARNRDAYTRAKTPFVEAILAKAVKKLKISANAD